MWSNFIRYILPSPILHVRALHYSYCKLLASHDGLTVNLTSYAKMMCDSSGRDQRLYKVSGLSAHLELRAN